MCFNLGLSSESFQGEPSILELQCTGDRLPANTDVLSMVLYEPRHHSNKIIAYVNVGKRECSTSESFVSCETDISGSRSVKLKTLILDLNEGLSRSYGCNVSVLETGGNLQIISWSAVVHRVSKYA